MWSGDTFLSPKILGKDPLIVDITAVGSPTRAESAVFVSYFDICLGQLGSLL